MRRFLYAAALLVCAAPTVRAQIPQSEYAARRAALAQAVGNGIVVAIGSPEPEEDYLSFFQNSRFRYLTGFREPDAALVFTVKDGKIVGKEMLFANPKNPAQEVWSGKRLQATGTSALSSMPMPISTRPMTCGRPIFPRSSRTAPPISSMVRTATGSFSRVIAARS